MSLKSCLAAMALISGALVSGLWTSTAMADVVTAKGVGTVSTHSGKPTADERQEAVIQAEANALDHYIAENDSAKQRMYDSARADIVAHLDKFVLSETILTENADKAGHTYTVTIRADINQNALDNYLGDSQGQSPNRAGGQDIALVFVSRSRSLVQTYDPRVHSRTETETADSCTGAVAGKTKESESVRSHSVGTSGTAAVAASSDCKHTDVSDTGGSTTRKADHVEWTVAEAANFDQQVTGAMTDSGYNLVPSEYVQQIDLQAIRNDYARGDDLAPQTLRGLVQAVKAAGLTYVVLGTMDVGMSDVDPVTGNKRVYVSINARLLDLSGAYPRPVAAIGPAQYSGLGPDDSVALTEATKTAAQEVAKTLINRLAVKGVR